MKKVTVIIVSYNTKELTKNCIDSVKKNTKGVKLEIIVVDNASSDGSRQYLKKACKKNLIEFVPLKDNIGFGPANNVGIKKSKGDYLLFLNSDTFLDSNLVKDMVEWMEKNPKYGICSCALKNKDGSYQGSGGYFPNLINVFTWMTIQDLPFVDFFVKPFHPMKEKWLFKNEKFFLKERDLDWITGAFMLVRREVINEITGFDEDYFMYTEEVDFCFRAKKTGWKVRYLPRWNIVHLGGASSGSEFAILSEFKGVKTFFKKHRPAWQLPILRLILKTGAILRIIFFGKVYWKAFLKI